MDSVPNISLVGHLLPGGTRNLAKSGIMTVNLMLLEDSGTHLTVSLPRECVH